jgi:iron(III) transport system substrate-binding protein
MRSSLNARSARSSRLLSLALPLVLAACGSGATTTPSPSAATSASAQPSASSAASGDASASESASASSSAGASEAASPSVGGSLVIYSGRSEELVQPLIDRFEEESGVSVEVNYAGTTDLAATLLEEGDASPADVFFSQDGGALGALASEGLLAELPHTTLDQVEDRFRSPDGQWVGVSGRARVLAYNTDAVNEDELPQSILELADPAWKGRIGWAPSNASLQTFVTTLRLLEGEDAARAWLEGVQANEPRVYEGNSQALEGVISGEVDVAPVNHYYLLAARAERGDIPAENWFFPGGDPGSLVNVAGAAILKTAKNPDAAQAFVDFLLSEESQTYFRDETHEYPLIAGVDAEEGLTPLDEIESPDVDLSDLSDLQGTLELMQEVGVL